MKTPRIFALCFIAILLAGCHAQAVKEEQKTALEITLYSFDGKSKLADEICDLKISTKTSFYDTLTSSGSWSSGSMTILPNVSTDVTVFRRHTQQEKKQSLIVKEGIVNTLKFTFESVPGEEVAKEDSTRAWIRGSKPTPVVPNRDTIPR